MSKLFFFDLEAGGLLGSQSSILSIAYGNKLTQEDLYAAPTQGSRVYKFSAENVWEPIKRKYNNRLETEKDILNKFITKLGGLEEGTTIAGWNIGYHAQTAFAKEDLRGFDLPMLATRTRKYAGMYDRLQKALRGKQVRDIGQEYAVIAARVALRNQEALDPTVFEQAVGFSKELYNYGVDISNTREAARIASVHNIKFSGWKQELMYETMFGEKMEGAHEALQDVRGGLRLSELTEDEIERRLTNRIGFWNKSVIANKAASSAKAALGEEEYYRAAGSKLVDQKIFSELASESWSAIKKHKVGLGVVAGVGALALLQPGRIFNSNKEEANTISGLQEDGMAAQMRHALTDFGSPVNLAKAAMRAQKLYKKHITKALKTKGIKAKDIQWLTDVEEDVVEGGWSTYVMAKSKEGELLAGMSRMFMHGEVNLTQIEVGKQLGGGLGKRLYQGEEKVLRKLGYKAGESVTSPVSNPITARWQMQMYGSQIDPEHATRLGNLKAWEQAIMERKVSHEQFPGITVTGRIAGKDDAYNTIEGLEHKGIAGWLRKKFTAFGSGWDALRGAVRAGETFSSMLKSSEFKAALKAAQQENILGEGMFGTAFLMKGKFREKEFQFVRKMGEIGPKEIAAMKSVEESIGPTLYGASLKRSRGITGEMGLSGTLDMELFEGSTLSKLSQEELSKVEGQIPEVFKALHKKGFVHKDPHLGNIMAVETPSGTQLGLIDYGNAARVTKGYNPTEDITTAQKMARAKIQGESQLAAIDPFSQAVSGAIDPFAQQGKEVALNEVLNNLTEDNRISGLSDQGMSYQARVDDGDWFSPAHLDRISKRAERTYNKMNQHRRLRTKQAKLHKEATKRATGNMQRPGRRHTKSAGSVVL